MSISPSDVSRLHAKAIKDRLDAYLVPENYTVYEGEVTDAEDSISYPYLVVWAAPAMRPTDRLAGYDGSASTITQITAAGTSIAEVLAALDRASLALHRWMPTIDGRQCDPISMDPAAPPPYPLRDPRVKAPDGSPVYSSVITVTFGSTPEPDGS